MSHRLLGKLSPAAEKIWREVESDVKSKALGKDPWEAREAWRYAPEYSPEVGRQILFGGSGYGLAAFVVYCLGEHLYSRLFPIKKGPSEE